MGAIAAIGAAFAGGGGGDAPRALILDVHSDVDHDRSVFTLAALPNVLSDALVRGAAAAIELIDVVSGAGGEGSGRGQHPHVGAMDVVPVVYLQESQRGAACAQALVVADRIGCELEVPVFLYGELTAGGAGESGRTRAELRRGGVAGLAEWTGSGPAAAR